MEIYTYRNTPFAFGGQYEPIKTNVEEYNRIEIGKDFYGILVHNTERDMWHLALDGCGAIIGSNKSKTKLINKIKNDVKTGDEKVMQQQIDLAKKDIKTAIKLKEKDFFLSFRSN